MVNVWTIGRMNSHYKKNRDKILSSGSRFATIDPNLDICYYDGRKSLYSEHPEFKPDATLPFGTLPKLIDIGKEINSVEYRREVLEETVDKANGQIDRATRDLQDAQKGLEKLSAEDNKQD